MRIPIVDEVYRPGRDLDAALRVVGFTRSVCREAVAAIHPSARGYLVGSLAFGLGNPSSDVDIHVFTETSNTSAGTVTRLSWTEGVTVDVDVQSPTTLHTMLDKLNSIDVHQTPIGTCALGGGPPHGDRRRLSRWLNALPISDEEADLIPGWARSRGIAWLRRDALEAAMVAAGLAVVASHNPSWNAAATYLWERARYAIAELFVRCVGDVTTGSKWLRAVVQRHGLTWPAVDDPSTANELWDALGVPFAGSLEALTVVEAAQNLRFRLGEQELVASRQGTVTRERLAVGRLDQVVAAGHAKRLLRDVASGLVDIVVRRDAVDAGLAA